MSSPSAGSSSPATRKIVLAKIEAHPDGEGGVIASTEENMEGHVLGYLEVQQEVTEGGTIYFQPNEIEIDGEHLLLAQGEEGGEIIVVVSTDQETGLTTMSKCDHTTEIVYAEDDHALMEVAEITDRSESQSVLETKTDTTEQSQKDLNCIQDDGKHSPEVQVTYSTHDNSSVVELVENSNDSSVVEIENSPSELQNQDIHVTDDASKSSNFIEVVEDSEERTVGQFTTQVIDEDGNMCYVVETHPKEKESLVSIANDESMSHVSIDNSDSVKDDESEVHLVTQDEGEYTIVSHVEGSDVIETGTACQAGEIGVLEADTPDVYHVDIVSNSVENETTIEVVEEHVSKISDIEDVQEDIVLIEDAEVNSTVTTKDTSSDVLDNNDAHVVQSCVVSDIIERVALQDAQNEGTQIDVTAAENEILIEVVDGDVAGSRAINDVSDNIALHEDTKSEEIVTAEAETLIEVVQDDDRVEDYASTEVEDTRGEVDISDTAEEKETFVEEMDVIDVSEDISSEKGNSSEALTIAATTGNSIGNLSVEGESSNMALSEDAEVSNSASVESESLNMVLSKDSQASNSANMDAESLSMVRSEDDEDSNSANQVTEKVEVESRTSNHISRDDAIESDSTDLLTKEQTSDKVVEKVKSQSTENRIERNHPDEETGKGIAEDTKEKMAVYDFTVEFSEEEDESESKVRNYLGKSLTSNSEQVTDNQVKQDIVGIDNAVVDIDDSSESTSHISKDVNYTPGEDVLDESERTGRLDVNEVELREKRSVSGVTGAKNYGVVRVSRSSAKRLNVSGNGEMLHDDVKAGGENSEKSELILANDTCITAENAERNETVIGNETITSENSLRTDGLAKRNDSASTQKVVHSKKRVPSRRKISDDNHKSQEKLNTNTSSNSQKSSKTKDSPYPESGMSSPTKMCSVVLQHVTSPTKMHDATSAQRRKSSRQQARRDSSEGLTPKLQKSLQKILSTPEKKSESGENIEVNVNSMVSKISSKLKNKEKRDGDKVLKRQDSSSKTSIDEPLKAKANGIHDGIAKESDVMTLNKMDNRNSKEKRKSDKQQQNATKRKLFTKDSPSKRARKSSSKKVTFSSGSDSQSQDERFDALLQCQNKMTKTFSSPRKSAVVVPLMSSLSFSPTKKRKTASASEECSPKKLKNTVKSPKKETKPSISNQSTPVTMKNNENLVTGSLGVKKEKCMFYIRYQSPTKTPEKEKTSPSLFNCKECHFKTSRIDNIIQHYKECSLVLQQDIFKWDLGQGMGEKTPTRFTLDKETAPPTVQSKSIPKKKDSQKKDTPKKMAGRKHSTAHSGGGDAEFSETKDNMSNLSDEFETDSDNDELPPAFGTPSKSDLPYKEDDIVWVDWKNQHWPALVRRIYHKTKKVSVLFIDTPMPTKGMRVAMRKISTFDNATRNKQFTSEGRTTNLGDKQIKAVQKAEDYLRKLCLGLKLSAFEFFHKADGGYVPDLENSSETTLDTENSLLDHPLFIMPSSPVGNGRNEVEDTDEEKMSPRTIDREEQVQKMKERRKKQNMNFLQCIKDGKVESHLMGVYQGTIANERHKKFHSEVASERNQLKHVTWFGPIDDEEQQEEIIDYCLNLFKTNFVKKETFDLMAYVFEVWTPEAIVKAISRVLLITLPEAEEIFEKGIEWVPEHQELLQHPSEKGLLEPVPP